MTDYAAPPSWTVFPDVRRAPRLAGHRNGETAASILVRLARANGMRNVGHLLRSTPHLRSYHVLNRDHRIEVAARLSGFDAEEIASATPKRMTYRSVSFNGELFQHSGSRPGRLCPVCIEEDLEFYQDKVPDLRAFRRGWWQIPSITTCPMHDTVLVSSCEHCGSGYDEKLPVTRCKCGAAVSRGQMVDPDNCMHDAWLLGRLGIGPAIKSPFLDGMPLGTAAELCRIVGKAMSKEPRRGPDREDNVYLAEMRTRGWHELAGGLPLIERLLDAIVDRERGRRRYCNTSYAGLHPFLTHNRCTSLDPVRELLTAHAVKNLGLSNSGARLFGRETFEGDRVSIPRAADALKICESRLIALLTATHPTSSVAALDSGLLDWSEFVSLRDILRNSIRTSAAKLLLGFDDRLFRAASNAGLLEFLVPVSGSFGLVRRGSVDALLRTFARPPIASGDELLDPKGFKQVARVSIADLMLAVAFGHLHPRGRRRDRKGFPGLLFRAEDALNLPLVIRGDMVKKGCARKELGWLIETFSALRAKGLLEVDAGPMVSMTAIRKFRRNFAAPVEAYAWLAAPMSFLSFCHMLRRKCGQPVVAGTAVTPFWDRSQLADALAPFMKADAIIHATGFGALD
ncbi:MAG TPA: TniQ family protein [Allosphingosinicella sp.]|nr:TniQ family protein [Allosphingosinicella sp.]